MNKKYKANKNHPELKEGVEVFYSGEFSDCWITRNCFKIPEDYEPPNKPDWYDEVKWKPEKREDYWFVDTGGDIAMDTWDEMSWDYQIHKVGNCYQTKEEAEQARERVLKAYKGE